MEYAWWPVRRGFFSRALNGRYCDVAIEAPSGLDMAGVTKPYFRSGYVFLTRKDSGLDIKSLADPRLKKLKIGVNLLNSDAENTPPAMALSRYGVVGNLTGYSTFYTRPGPSRGHRRRRWRRRTWTWPSSGARWPDTSPSSRRAAADVTPLARAGLAERLPVPVQHRHGRAPPRHGAARQPRRLARAQGARRSRRSSSSTACRCSRSSRRRAMTTTVRRGPIRPEAGQR